MTVDDDTIPDPVLREASSWAFRLHGAPDDVHVRDGLQAWISQDEMHARAWKLTSRAWQLTASAPLEFAHEWPVRSTGARRSAVAAAVFGAATGLRRRKRLAALALAACLLLAAAWPSIQLRLTADHITAVAEQRRVPLEDGSVVTLAPASAITVAVGPASRTVSLVSGEAFFEVASDRNRPFTVRGADLSVVVTGTAFNVALTDRSFSVAVASGSVRVERSGGVSQPAIDLAAGEGVLVDRASRQATVGSLPTRSVAAWRAGRLVAEDIPLTDVVAAIGRYHAGAVVVASASLRGKRVTGVYDLNDPLRAMQVLAAPYNATVREITPWLLVLSAN